MNQRNPQSEILVFSTRALKKLLLSSFVVGTFVAYAVRERLNGADGGTLAAPASSSQASSFTESSSPSANSSNQTLPASQAAKPPPQSAPAAAPAPQSALAAAPAPSATPVPVLPHHLYQDGQFTGVVADAYWGNVQVEAVIQDGKITDVQFLDYPQDRRTSRFINSQAVPWLHDEAIQAQSANVNIISGATLTSEAFIQSLQTALDKARNQA